MNMNQKYLMEVILVNLKVMILISKKNKQK